MAKAKSEKASFSDLCEVVLMALVQMMAGQKPDDVLDWTIRRLPDTGFRPEIAARYVEGTIKDCIMAGREAEAVASAQVWKALASPEETKGFPKEITLDTLRQHYTKKSTALW